MINEKFISELDFCIQRFTKGDKFCDIPTVPYKNKKYWAIVIKVIDGDTIKIISNCDGHYFKTNIRLANIDAPELHSKNSVEQNAAKKVKLILEEQILGKRVVIENLSLDKYGGRIVGNVFIDSINCSDYLKNNCLVRAYNGGKKEKWTNKELISILNK